ncbi:DUF2927 family protein [Pacificibacter maritimus]|uniref:DUF2927 family protein n=1 Tax=Pacificibacter maritimus TaxID=762213 RepID=A0A3N4UM90_9RHOB|nr:DUF2927 domain-containing protein [Pacificibacter maritimus]RPE71766.1 DUF2927 family protein [Pacificibacter maritimus]
MSLFSASRAPMLDRFCRPLARGVRICVMTTALVSLVGCATKVSTPRSNTARAPSVVLDLPPMKLFQSLRPTRTARSNTAIARDFLDLSFLLENGTVLQSFTRFEGPITLRVVGDAIPASLGPDLETLISRLRTEADIDITRVAPNSAANITIQTLPHAQLRKRAPNTACIVAPNISSWNDFRQSRRANLSWSTVTKRETLSIFIPNDEAPQEIRDCLHEELAQALGPLNDLYRLTDSVFNDDNIHSVLTEFDMLILRATYAPELRTGMTRAQVSQRLPALLNRLNPAGNTRSTPPYQPISRIWNEAVMSAMRADSSATQRITAASQAVTIAQSENWTDARMGFSLFLLGRLSFGSDPVLAQNALSRAYDIYSTRSDTAYHKAHVALQLSALALLDRNYEQALAYSSDAIPTARAAGNAALLASLMMTKAESLTAMGRASEARMVRLDSLGWARYGFGTDEQVHARTSEIASLARN